MKKQLLLILFLSTLSAPLFSQHAQKSEKLKLLMASVNIPGIQLIHCKNGQTDAYSLGTTADKTKEPVTSNSIFEAASLSKAVFAYTVLRLTDQGVIQLDTPLLNYTGGSYERFDTNNPAYSKITARMVLRHTTGFRNWADDGKIPLLFPPDSCFNYSGEAYMYLLAVLEKITNKNLEQLAQEETLIPLGMKNSSFRWNPKFAGIATFGSDSAAIQGHNELNSASSLLTNAQDYSIFLRAVLSGRGLKPSTHQLMLALQTQGNWFNHPAVEATAHIGWGLGVGIQQNEKGKALWQWGENGDFKAFYIAFPQSGEYLVYFSNSWRGLYIIQQVIDLFLGKQTTWAIPWIRNSYYDPYAIGYDDPYAVSDFRQHLEQRGFASADLIWKNEKKQNPSFLISEKDLRAFANILTDKNQTKNAFEVLKFNAKQYAENADAMIGLAEGYYAIGNNQEARRYLNKCLAIDPSNASAFELLKKLTPEKL